MSTAEAPMNTVKTGLTGRTIILPSNDAEAYSDHVARQFDCFEPRTDEEHTLVQFIADTKWRLLRIAPLEAGIWAVARLKLASLHPEVADPAQRAALIDAEIQLAYRKDLQNLALQERRLRKQLLDDSEKLLKLQEDRFLKASAAAEQRQTEMQRALEVAVKAKQENYPFEPAEFGFEFSIDQIDFYRSKINTYKQITGQLPNVDKILAKFAQQPKAA